MKEGKDGMGPDHMSVFSRNGDSTLSRVAAGSTVTVAAVHGDDSFRGRMIGIGIVPGVAVSVLEGGPRRPFLLATAGGRFMLDWMSVQKIEVRGCSGAHDGEKEAGMKLKDVKLGASVVVRGYEESNPGYRSKLLAMGLTKGSILKIVKVAPLGDPVEVEVRGYDLSLRKAEADVLIVEDVV